MARILAVLCLLAIVASLAPGATAQMDKQLAIQCCEFEVDGLSGTGRLDPNGGLARITGHGLVVVPQLAYCTVPIRVSLSGSGPSYSSWGISPPTQFLPYHGEFNTPVSVSSSQSLPFKFQMLITTTSDAPAMADGEYLMTARANAATVTTSGGTCNLADSPLSKTKVAIKNEYVPKVQVTQLDAWELAEPGLVKIELVNLGNGPTRVELSVAPEHSARFDELRLPPDARLESRAGRAEADTTEAVLIEYQLAADRPVRIPVHWRASYDGAADDAPTWEEDLVVEFAPTGAGGPQDSDIPAVPGFDVLVLAGAVAGIAGLRGRRRA